jgi:hypothetical protein
LAGFCWVPARGVFVDLIGVIGISQVRSHKHCFAIAREGVRVELRG